jgi:hypothetical protein
MGHKTSDFDDNTHVGNDYKPMALGSEYGLE